MMKDKSKYADTGQVDFSHQKSATIRSIKRENLQGGAK